MKFRNDLPNVGVIVSVKCFCFVLEAKVECRYLDAESAMEELQLSGGAIIRRNSGSDQFRIWLNGEIGEKEAMAVEKIEIL